MTGQVNRQLYGSVSIILLLIARADIKEKRIPNRLLGILLLCAAADGIWFQEPTWGERIAGSILVSSVLFLAVWITPGSFGAGDIKLMAVSGILLGVRKNIAAFIFAVVLAGIYCIVAIALKKKEKTSVIAFGPFLCMGIELAMIWGEKFIRWYVS